MPKFSLIIISYNGKEFLRRCLNAVLKSERLPSQIIIVDDFSDDGTDEMIQKEFRSVDFIRNEKNLGPTATRNRGAKIARENYLVFMDNDVLVRPDSLSDLVKFLEKNPEVGIVGGKVIPEGKEKTWWNMGYDPNNLRESFGYICGFLLERFPKSKWLKDLSMHFVLNYWDYDKILEVDWVVETCFAIKRDVFEKVGGFDEQFFMFYEGPDLCKRIRKAGYKAYFNPEVTTDLLEGHTHQNKRNEFFLKSKYLFYKKHYFYLRSNPILFWVGRIISGILYKIA